MTGMMTGLLVGLIGCCAFVSCKERSPSSKLTDSELGTSRFVSGYQEPPIAFDKGAGAYDSVPATIAATAKRDAARVFCKTAAPALYGKESAFIFDHYLGNTGKDINIQIDSAVEDSTAIKLLYYNELRAALDYSVSQSEGQTQFSSRTPLGSKVTRDDSLNWYLALGGFQVWSQSTLDISQGSSGATYSLKFDFYLRDRYNWDSGHTFNLGKLSVTSDELGAFHRMGIAKEFTTFGVVRKVYTWRHSEDRALVPFAWPAIRLTEKDLKIRAAQNIN
jgi:hypothetical protein